MATYYRLESGVFDGKLVNAYGVELQEHTFTRLHPLMAMLDAAADEDGFARIKNIGVREKFEHNSVVKYDLYVA